MRRFEGSVRAPGGFYFNQKSWDLVTVSGKAYMRGGSHAIVLEKIAAEKK